MIDFESQKPIRMNLNNSRYTYENLIIEIDKKSLEIKRRINGNWVSSHLLNTESNENLQIAAYNQKINDFF